MWSSPARSPPESTRRDASSALLKPCRWGVPAPWKKLRGRWFSCSRSSRHSPRGRCCGWRGEGDQQGACVLAATTYDRRQSGYVHDDVKKETFMVAAVRVHKYGGPEALTYEDIDIPAPGPGQVRLKQHAAGINFIDTYFRMGMYPSPVGMPFVAGNEGAGEVIAGGPGVADFKVGDRVGYVTALGCYAAERLVPADRAVKIPPSISYEQAAAMMLKGMTVEYLVRRTFKVEKGQNVFVHAAAGGVGLILCQWANHLGANVIGTVGSTEKAALAKANGCHHTILYRDEDL